MWFKETHQRITKFITDQLLGRQLFTSDEASYTKRLPDNPKWFKVSIKELQYTHLAHLNTIQHYLPIGYLYLSVSMPA